jgi:1-pyrroline-5-carboxylate dehydrogenase
MVSEFRNEPLTDFSKPENRKAMEQALEQVRGQLGRTWPMIIDGKEITDGPVDEVRSPFDRSIVVGCTVRGTDEHARQAILAADRAFRTWQFTDPRERAEGLFRTAAKIRERKFELAAWMIYEVSKTWVEADADVAELIDFAEYYGREMLRLADGAPVTQVPGERNEMRYIPLGVGAIIPPWNFPGAIMGGMTMAAVVTGNTTVLKPAHTSPIIAAIFARIFIEEAGLPPGVVNYITGPGGLLGDAMVDHPRTRFIAFTGSKEIGLRIFERAAKVHPGQIWLKRTILEMGGKDAIIVDETADLDAAADGIVASAFGFQGQKCSACSRAIIVDSVYDEVLQKVAERTKTLKVGDPREPDTNLGAVIDRKAFDKIRSYIEIGEKEGRMVLRGETANGEDAYHIAPTIVADVKPDSRIAQEEIFGPVLAFIRAKDYDEALEIANGTEFGLTGAVYSLDKDRLERARREFHVGNLYLNRKCTGALVGVQPFGGFNMSGTDSKAGGPDYLILFMQGKSIADRTPGVA